MSKGQEEERGITGQTASYSFSRDKQHSRKGKYSLTSNYMRNIEQKKRIRPKQELPCSLMFYLVEMALDILSSV